MSLLVAHGGGSRKRFTSVETPGHVHVLGDRKENITLRALQARRIATVSVHGHARGPR